jgi:signal transduction histidine kinase
MLLSMIPILVVGYLSFRSGRLMIEQETINHLLSTNVHKQAGLDRWVQDSARDIEIFSKRPHLTDQLIAVMASHDPADAQHIAQHRSIIDDHLSQLIEGGEFLELSLLRPVDGLVVISTDQKQEGKSLPNRPYFVQGKNRTFIQNVYYSMALEQPTMTVGTPIRDKQGNLVAVLAGRVNLAELTRIMEHGRGLRRTEDSYLVNSFNFFVTEPRFGKDYALKRAIHTEGVEAALAHRDGIGFYANYRGVPVIGAYQWIPERELCLITELGQSEALAPIYALRKTIFGLGVAVALLAALLGWFFAFTITRPVRRLVGATEEIGRGNLNYTLAASGRDEIGDLSRAFGRMAQLLKDTLVSRDELAREVAEREQAEQTLQEKNTELERFIYTVSHDLKSPLVTVKTFLGYLEQGLARADASRIEKDMAYIRNAADKMGQLLDELLEMSRIGRIAHPPERIAFGAMVQEALSAVAGAVAERGVAVQVGEAPITLHGDRRRLVEIWQNLVENAVKFMGDQASPRIEIGVEARGAETVFFVRDNGIGIDARYREKVFGLFEKLDPRSEGTGLGLALVKRIVELYRGTIWLESEGAGHGVCVRFTLPAAIAK